MLAVLAVALAICSEADAFVAGIVLTTLGLLTILRGVRNGRGAVGPASAGDDSHEHAHSPRVAWLLLLPLLAILLVAPAPLGADAAGRSDAQAPPSPAADSLFGPLPAPSDGAVELTVTEFLQRALYDDARSLEAVPVRLRGFVVVDPETSDGYLLTRFVLSCCAADGFPIQVAATCIDGPPPPDDTWVEVVGTWDPPAPDTSETDGGGPAVAALAAESQTVIDPPAKPYEQTGGEDAAPSLRAVIPRRGRGAPWRSLPARPLRRLGRRSRTPRRRRRDRGWRGVGRPSPA